MIGNKKALAALVILTILISSIMFLNSCTMMSELSAASGYAAVQGPEFEVYTGLKRTIAVLPFEDNTSLGESKAGEAASAMILGVLSRSGRFIIVERSNLEEVISEQALGQSGAITLESAVQAGRISGVQAIVLGSVESLDYSYNRKDLDSEKKDWGISLMGSRGFAEINCRLVDVVTGEILFSGRASGSHLRPGLGIRTEEFDINDEHSLDETVVGVSLRKAANKMAADIVESVDRIRWYGKVIKSVEGNIYITPGINNGLEIGTRLRIIPFTIRDDIEDIETAESIAEIEVTGFVGTRLATAQLVSGSEIKSGYIVLE
jgi:curli biogenesis system outer membrane secretion channel CsgG